MSHGKCDQSNSFEHAYLASSTGSWRLPSWKENAVYVRREVCSVQRWEKREAMSVHRHRHPKGNSAYAFREEIDAWLISRPKVSDPGEPQRCLFC